MGRLLGVGPGGECFVHALACRYGVFALSNDSTAPRHAQAMEHWPDSDYFCAVYLRHLPYSKRGFILGAFLRRVQPGTYVHRAYFGHNCWICPVDILQIAATQERERT